jgi:hypothetical protein
MRTYPPFSFPGTNLFATRLAVDMPPFGFREHIVGVSQRPTGGEQAHWDTTARQMSLALERLDL